MHFSCFLAYLCGKERFCLIVSVHLDGVVSDGTSQDMADGAENWKGVFSE